MVNNDWRRAWDNPYENTYVYKAPEIYTDTVGKFYFKEVSGKWHVLNENTWEDTLPPMAAYEPLASRPKPEKIEKPLVVNFYGGPGSGKSTTAAGLFHYLKMAEVNVELVTEFAKDETWNGSLQTLSYQPYVFGQQAWRIERLRGKVDVVVTDSPIILSSIYASKDLPTSFHDYVLWEHQRTNSLDFFLRRVKKYNSIGRNQTEEEAKEIDEKIVRTLNGMGVEFHEFLTGDGTASIKAFGLVMKSLGKE